MPHSFYKIWLHVIFSTKNRENIIAANHEKLIYNFMEKQLRQLGCPVRIINGMPEHIHILFLQNPTKSVSEVIKQVKGSTSRWINEERIIPVKFEWQTGFGVFSVSESHLEKIYKYIRNQKEHHKNQSVINDYENILK